MTDSVFQDPSLYAHNLPVPTPKFGGMAQFNFIGGHNDPEHIPVEGLVAAAQTALRREGPDLAMYNLAQGPQGHLGLRQVVADKLKRHRGIDTNVDDILITTGSGQGIGMVTKLLVNPGDKVLVEEFCYAGALGRIRAGGAETIALQVDEHGIRTDQLENVLTSLKANGQRAKFVYTIPTIQNPTGSVMPMERRQQLLAVCKAFGVPVFEDECYADLVWAGSAPPALYGIDPNQVVHLGSFSKTLAPALRLGYMVAPWELLRKLMPLKPDGGTGALEQMVVAEYFGKHFDDHVPHLTQILKSKRDVMIEAVEREFGTEAKLFKPEGGIFLWIKLPDTVDVTKLLAPAAQVGVAFNPGPEWAVDPKTSTSYLRLCFGSATVAEINEGVKRLARVCYEQTGIPSRSANTINQ